MTSRRTQRAILGRIALVLEAAYCYTCSVVCRSVYLTVCLLDTLPLMNHPNNGTSQDAVSAVDS